ncbi:hypothetical protein [uncultured Lutibacter sp.]|uniref:hypothetical protein n=1 Tax=uncultured Lutibacter sp. TaxID=437739 RepID=UPI002630F2BB|nr:hypothetical protein [uncultured Lutibacter sp.]
MLLSIFSNPNTAHLIEIFCWMLGAFLIGLFFGRFIKSKEKKNTHNTNTEIQDDLNIVDDISKIRATQTFKRGGVEMLTTVPLENENGLNFNRIGTATFQEKDNLQQIKGIGTSIEEKLNNIGIFTFKQISNFNSKDITEITDLIKFFPGRIERDDWVGQAYSLLNDKEE